MRQYTFKNGLVCTQDELTLSQDYKVIELLKTADLPDMAKLLDLSLAELVSTLVEKDLITKLFQIILTPGNSEDVIDTDAIMDLTNSEIYSVLMDFFSLNQSVIKILQTFSPDLTMIDPLLKSSSTGDTVTADPQTL